MIFNMIAQAAQAAGLEYEEGSITPSSNFSDNMVINYNNPHSTAPSIVAGFADLSGYNNTTYTMHGFVIYDYRMLTGKPEYVSSGNQRYGTMIRMFRGSSATSISTYTNQMASETDLENYVDNARMSIPSNNSSTYWRAGITYKWIAIWI